MRKYLLLTIFLLVGYTSAQEYRVSDLDSALKKNADASIRNLQTTLLIKSVNNMESILSSAVTVFNKNGENSAMIAIPYDKETKLGKITVTILDENGKKIKTYSRSDFKDYSYGGSSVLYTDSRLLLLSPDVLNFPYTVVTNYSVKTTDTAFFPDYTPVDAYRVSLEKSEIKIINSSGINFRSKNIETFLGKAAESKSNTDVTYSFANFPAIKEEYRSPDLNKILPRVKFSLDEFSLAGTKGSLKNWDAFGIWYYNNLLVPASVPTEQLKQEVAALQLSGTIDDKVRKLYQFMQDKTRYIAVEMGIGGWRPMDADDVRQKSYGDCKAVTNYMRTLLDLAGIKSYFAVINSDHSVVNFDQDFPKLGGNHAVLMVPTDHGQIWLENTSQKVAYNHLFSSTTDRNVLAIDENGIKIIETPIYGPNQNKSWMTSEISLIENGTINGSSTFKMTGWQYDNFLALASLSNKEALDALKGRFSEFNYQSAEVKNIKNDRDNAFISFEFDYTAGNYAKKVGQDLLLNAVPLRELSSINENQDEKRTLPIENAFAYADEYKITYNLPKGYKISAIPETIQLSSEYGAYSLEAKVNDKGQIIIQRTISINKGTYPKEQFENYVKFTQKMVRADNSKILLTKI